MSWWMWLAISGVGWFAISALVGRYSYTDSYREDREKGVLHEKAAVDATHFAWLGFWLWPIVASAAVCIGPFVLPYKFLKWFFGGGVRADRNREVRRHEEAQQLQADAEAWDKKAADGTEVEREMAAELARMCRERAREVVKS